MIDLLDLFPPQDVYALMWLTSGMAIVALIAIECARVWRDWQLSRLDPPSADELDAIREAFYPGSFRLAGRDSAAARHFETDSPPLPTYGGSSGCYEPTFVDTWRERRTDDD